MTTLTVQVDNEENAALLKKMLKALSFAEDVDVNTQHSYLAEEPRGTYKKVKKTLDNTDEEVFRDINDPSKWQRDLRDEWERNS